MEEIASDDCYKLVVLKLSSLLKELAHISKHLSVY